MSNDIIYIFWWWLVFLAIGVASIPLAWLFFKRFIDLGYGFAKTIGFLIIAFITFLAGIFRILPFTSPVLYLITFIYLILNYYIFKKHKTKILSDVTANFRTLLTQEFIFTFGLVFWSYVRAHQPDIRGLEKFMDLGFINSILRSNYLPPADMWFAGESINYYWFGHFYVALITKLTNIPSSITYNLMLATILGLGLAGSFSLVATLSKSLWKKINLKMVFVAGVLSAILLNFGGNFHTPYYLAKEGKDNYWYPDATRFIGYNPDVDDKTIHEFPMYSFVVSDLHAHLINFPFVLLYLALLWNFINKKRESNTVKYLNLGSLGFVLGIMFMTSTWDFGNYLLTSGVVVGFFHLKKYGIKLKAVINSAITVGTILFIAALTLLPFYLNFESIAQGVKLVHSHTPLWQLEILWGFPAILTIILMTLLTFLKPKFKKSDLFILSLHIASWILIILPEIFYVKDIYIASHYRANTMFKLTYQAFVMFYLSSGYIAIRTFTLAKNHLQRLAFGLTFIILFTLILLYPSIAINSYYADLKNYQGLNGIAWVEKQFPEQYEVINWFNKNVDGQPYILESPGDSYTDFNLISAYTGLPTVSGWFVHEWLWRGDASFPQARVADITQVYTSANIGLTKSLLKKYNVEYVIIGANEREKYPNLNESKFSQLGQEVFSSGSTNIYKIKKTKEL